MIQYWVHEDLDCPDEQAKPGGSCTIYVVRHRDVVSMPHHVPGQPTMAALIIQEGANYYSYKLDSDSVRMTDNQLDSNQGSAAEISLSGFRTQMDIDHQTEIEKLRPGHYLVIWEDSDKRRRLLGTLDRPLLFKGSGDTGAQDQDDTGFSWSFTGTQVGPSCYMSQILPIPTIISTPCAVLSMEDFTLNPWYFDSSGDFTGVSVTPNPTGDIASVNANPSGQIDRVSDNQFITFVYYNTGSGLWQPLAPITLDPGTYRVTIPLLPVTLKGSSANCSITFIQEFTVPGGAFDDPFSSSEFD